MLEEYNKKRNFKKTKEPVGKIAKTNKKWRYIIQHHLARKDHFDFRLEYNGVLVSFAVPKNLSLNPHDKRLAIRVEDHPLSYRNFEGTIAKGEYGAGIVMLWDKGTWTNVNEIDFNNGFKFKINGSRLKGIWTLVKFKENFLIIKENHFLWAIKHYYEKKDFYFLGIKLFSKKIQFDNLKNFVVFNTAYFGDVLLCNSLCQNIKNIFPEGRVIFVVDKKWADIAKYQESVDDVVIYDKKGKNKGLIGLLKFVKDFPYKKIYASFVTYGSWRNYFASKLLKSKYTLTNKKLIPNKTTQEKHNLLITSLTHKKVKNYPIKFNLPNNIANPLADIISDKKYITLCCISKNPIKDMPLEIAKDLINKIEKETDKNVVLVGNGDDTLKFAQNLEKSNCHFINLVNKTTLLELGKILKASECLISIDTGTMHYSYSLGVKTLCVFFEKGTTHLWAPKADIYPHTLVIDGEIDSDKIYSGYKKLIGQQENV